MEMNRILKNSQVFMFCLAVILVLSTILPMQGLAATSTAKQNWKVTTNGGPLFEPLVQSNGSLLFGNYKIIKNVYNTEIMNISTNGKISGKWSLKADKVELGGTKNSPKILAIHKSKGIITAYSKTGKKLWSYNFKTEFDWETWYQFDQSGNFYLFKNDQIYKVSNNGKLVYKKTGSGDYLSPNGEMYQVNLNREKPANTTLTKLSTTGKTVFSAKLFVKDKDLKYLEAARLGGVTDHHIYVTAAYYNESKGTQFYKLYILNKNGELVKNIAVQSLGIDVVENKDTAYAADSKYLYKLNSKGSVVKKTAIPGKDSYGDPEYISSLQITSKGEVYGMGSNHFYKFTSSGALDWKIYNKNYALDLSLFNGKHYATFMNENYIYIYDSKGKKVSQISVGAKTGHTFLTADPKKKTVFVTNASGVFGKEKTTVISVKQ